MPNQDHLWQSVGPASLQKTGSRTARGRHAVVSTGREREVCGGGHGVLCVEGGSCLEGFFWLRSSGP